MCVRLTCWLMVQSLARCGSVELKVEGLDRGLGCEIYECVKVSFYALRILRMNLPWCAGLEALKALLARCEVLLSDAM